MNGFLDFLAEKSGLAGFAALFILKLGEMLWTYFRRREKITDESIKELKAALEKNTFTLSATQTEMQKLKLDLRKCFFAIKKTSGENWARIASEMQSFSNPDAP